MVASMERETVTEPPAFEPVACRTCGQLLIKRWPGGGFSVVVKGEYYDREGRLIVQCPNCGRRFRQYPANLK